MNIKQPITAIKGIGESKAKSLNKLGVYTVGDILLRFPRTYYMYQPPVGEKDIKNHIGEKIALQLELRSNAMLKKTKRFDIVLAKGFTPNLIIELVWFRTPYVRNKLYTYTPLVFFGKLIEEYGTYKMEQPEIYQPREYENLCKKPYPIYSLTKGVSN
ncbi:MAG: DNA helicase RecG, partial [Lachnospiraceae bacterium]|nr:DNA helicase RecG [Lachnospiraceae bacterium]